MIIYRELPVEEKDRLVQEFIETAIDLPDPDNYPKVVETMFRFFLYSKGVMVQND
jgi:hypothetical protein